MKGQVAALAIGAVLGGRLGQRSLCRFTGQRHIHDRACQTPLACTADTSGASAAVRAVEPWYTPIPADAAVVDDHGALGNELAAEIAHYYGHASINTTNYAPVVVTVPASQPTVAIAYWNCQGKRTPQTDFIRQMSTVPLPTNTVIPTDSDAHVVVWQPSTDTVWELWKTRRIDGQTAACWGGRLDHASQSSGTFPFPFGGTATGISTLAGLVTPDDLARGHIDHALSIGVVNTRSGAYSWPADRTDGRHPDPGAVLEGQRFRLDPTIDLSRLQLTPFARMIAEALQRYGAIVRDTTGAVAIYAESALPDTTAGRPDPYPRYYGGKPKWAQLDPIPWNRMQALPVDYGRT